MKLLPAMIIFNVLILMYQIITEVFTTLYRINGITVDKAKFQVISLLTATGFTTNESETMLLTKKRRKLTQNIMLFSYIFNVTIVSTIVNVFSSTQGSTTNELVLAIAITIATLAIIYLFRHFRGLKSDFDNWLMKMAQSKRRKKSNFIFVYDTYGTKSIAEVEITRLREDFVGKNIEEIELKKKYDLQLLVIKRGEEIISQITPECEIKENDVLILFGKIKTIKNIFLRNVENNKDKVKLEGKV